MQTVCISPCFNIVSAIGVTLICMFAPDAGSVRSVDKSSCCDLQELATLRFTDRNELFRLSICLQRGSKVALRARNKRADSCSRKMAACLKVTLKHLRRLLEKEATLVQSLVSVWHHVQGHLVHTEHRTESPTRTEDYLICVQHLVLLRQMMMRRAAKTIKKYAIHVFVRHVPKYSCKHMRLYSLQPAVPVPCSFLSMDAERPATIEDTSAFTSCGRRNVLLAMQRT
jgi:hypothetical protein